jgi:murein L,D-transpeptidase YcbB/YkuD
MFGVQRMGRANGARGLKMAVALACLASVGACKRVAERAAPVESSGEIAQTWKSDRVEEVRGVGIDTLRGEIRAVLERGPKAVISSHDDWRHVRALYGIYGGGPLFLETNGAGGRAKVLLEALSAAPEQGLRTEHYRLAEIQAALDSLAQTKSPTPAQIAATDVMLTTSFAELGEDMLVGQVDPRKLSQDWHISTREDNVDSALARIVRSEPLGQALEQLQPRDAEYQALQGELERYRKMAANGGWTPIPEGKALKPGQTDTPERLSQLRARLRSEGIDVDDGGDSATVYTPALAGAVAQYQTRHGIDVDSVLGTGTVKSMNVPAEYRAGQIAANLERYRWLPRSFGARYIHVNVPAFRLQAFEDGKPTLEMKVIVGADYENRNTPVFSDSMQYVVFRPYWYPTDSISAKELWPKARSDGSYLARNGYEVVRMEGKPKIRQKPGDKNALGLVNFIFPNAFDIYLHDTPDAKLFDEDVRAFSHGCIRVEKPAELAQWVLGWDLSRVEQEMQSGKDDHRVDLAQKVPVFITYFTTFRRDGTLHFGNDLYDRDRALITAAAN